MTKRVDLLAQEPGRFLYVKKRSTPMLYMANYDPKSPKHWILQSRNHATNETTRVEYLLQHELQTAMRTIAPIAQWDQGKLEGGKIRWRF